MSIDFMILLYNSLYWVYGLLRINKVTVKGGKENSTQRRPYHFTFGSRTFKTPEPS